MFKETKVFVSYLNSHNLFTKIYLQITIQIKTI